MDFPFDFFGKKTLKKVADGNPAQQEQTGVQPSSIDISREAQQNALQKLAPMTGSQQAINAVKSVTPTGNSITPINPNKTFTDSLQNPTKKKVVK